MGKESKKFGRTGSVEVPTYRSREVSTRVKRRAARGSEKKERGNVTGWQGSGRYSK